MKKNKYCLILIPFMLLSLWSCSTVPTSINNSLSEELFFKNAQDAMDLNQYNVALYYYEVYIVRYPENHDKVIAAEYEKALIYFKTKEYDYSRDLFLQILDKYENSPFAILFPERYKILSEKILVKINEKITKS